MSNESEVQVGKNILETAIQTLDSEVYNNVFEELGKLPPAIQEALFKKLYDIFPQSPSVRSDGVRAAYFNLGLQTALIRAGLSVERRLQIIEKLVADQAALPTLEDDKEDPILEE